MTQETRTIEGWLEVCREMTTAPKAAKIIQYPYDREQLIALGTIEIVSHYTLSEMARLFEAYVVNAHREFDYYFSMMLIPEINYQLQYNMLRS